MRIIVLCSFIIFLFSCKQEKQIFKLLKVTEHSSSKVSDVSLVNLLEAENDFTVEIDYTLSVDSALKLLNDKKADLVILPNNVTSNNILHKRA